MTLATINDLKKYREKVSKKKLPDVSVCVCVGTGCRAKGAEEIFHALKTRIKKNSTLNKKVSIKSTGCHGFCEGGPLVTIENRKTNTSIFYTNVQDKHVDEIVNTTLKKR